MLVLTRKKGETIHIGDEIEVTILEVRGTRVRLGITAPTQFNIWRSEIYLEKFKKGGIQDSA